MGNKPSIKSKPVVSTEGLFFYGPDADGRSSGLQPHRLGSIPTVSTMINTVASC